jgi:hypothetical protein
MSRPSAATVVRESLVTRGALAVPATAFAHLQERVHPASFRWSVLTIEAR